MKKSKIGFVSLGCSKNLMDTEVMLSELSKEGYEITAEESEADIVIINTCGFIEDSKKEAIDNILDIAWLKKHAKLKGIIVTGCLVQRYGAEVLKQFPEIDAVLSVGSIHDIVEAVKAVEKKEKYTSLKAPECAELGGDRIVTTPEYYAYIKIAEGCDNRCTYCAIPNIRGKFRSRKIEDIVNEAKEMESLGAKEIVLIAQDTTRYGLDIYGEYKLDELIREITKNTTIPWIRILYCYPDKITDGLVNEFKTNDRLVKYIDMPIQHINDTILKKMNRHGGSEVIKDSLRRLREACPSIIVRSTVIVGFPGETEKHFEELIEFIKEARFEKLGAFKYSKEEGTPAAEMSNQVSEAKKEERYEKLMTLQTEISDEITEKMMGKVTKVLVEGYDPILSCYFCRGQEDAPEIDGKIYLNGVSKNKFNPGDFAYVKYESTIDGDIIASLVSKK